MVETAPVSVILLTHNEAACLPECLQSLAGLRAQVFVVDSGSTDGTDQIARRADCRVVEHPFENYAAQRNWALRNLPIETEWVLCLDADERLTPELVEEISDVVRRRDAPHDGYLLRKRTYFLGRWIKHGGQYPSYHLRLFRHGRGRCENRLYDQHFLVDGSVGQLQHDYLDVLSADLTSWTERHNRWATLEAMEAHTRGSSKDVAQDVVRPRIRGNAIERKRFLRTKLYGTAPLFARAFFLWFYAYVIRLGFLDGTPGLIFHGLQRFWFRFLVDAKIYEFSLHGRKSGQADALAVEGNGAGEDRSQARRRSESGDIGVSPGLQ